MSSPIFTRKQCASAQEHINNYHNNQEEQQTEIKNTSKTTRTNNIKIQAKKTLRSIKKSQLKQEPHKQ